MCKKVIGVVLFVVGLIFLCLSVKGDVVSLFMFGLFFLFSGVGLFVLLYRR